MMSGKPIIEVKNLSKAYKIGMDRTYKRFSESAVNVMKHPIKSIRSIAEGHEEFYALKDISFEVEPGEIVGIIGRNGAGKSTLLKVLTGITYPTSGEVIMRGRVGSLLEVGTGFHPELTGRENIFFNGAILGMRKREIEDKFDEIVKFSGVEQFIDTPVKRYSSGMQVRLAFSVAAHLDPEILLVDEVLAVGDAQFQKKCLGKMGEVVGEGRTVLFVSHNMAAISSLCNISILLDEGNIQRIGETNDVINTYLNEGHFSSGEVIFSKNKPGDDKAILHAARILDKDFNTTTTIRINEPFYLEEDFELFEDNMRVYPNIHIFDSYGQYVFVTSDSETDPTSIKKSQKGIYTARCMIPPNLFNSGTFYVGFALTSIYPLHVHFFENNLLYFTIHDPIDNIPTRIEGYSGSIPGSVRPLLEWEII